MTIHQLINELLYQPTDSTVYFQIDPSMLERGEKPDYYLYEVTEVLPSYNGLVVINIDVKKQ